MKIDRLELFQVAPRWLFLKITTDDGFVGWGEPIVEGRANTTGAAVEELSDNLIGRDPRHIEDIFQTLHRGGFYRGGAIMTSAISGIEQALWDIKGKFHGVPVYDLLGGPVRHKVRTYGHIGGYIPPRPGSLKRGNVKAADDYATGGAPKSFVEHANELVAAGYTVLKMGLFNDVDWVESPAAIDQAVGIFGSVREAVGREIDIAIDFHGRVRKPLAKVLAKELEQFSPMFYEELLLPEHLDGLREVANVCAVPLATGERMFTRWAFKEVLQAGYIDILQPDVSHTGGIWELRKIAAMAEAYDVAIAPHCPLGPLTLASSLQIDFCTPNAFLQEQALQVATLPLPYVKGSPYKFEDGFILRNDLPGLGLEIDEEAVRDAAEVGHRWRNPLLRTEDGAFAEW